VFVFSPSVAFTVAALTAHQAGDGMTEKTRIEVVLSDVQMPVLDGTKTL
jgi:CheY-like chemotaxis protein